MANTITAKRISAKEQNSARVTLHIDTSGATDSDLFEFTFNLVVGRYLFHPNDSVDLTSNAI